MEVIRPRNKQENSSLFAYQAEAQTRKTKMSAGEAA